MRDPSLIRRVARRLGLSPPSAVANPQGVDRFSVRGSGDKPAAEMYCTTLRLAEEQEAKLWQLRAAVSPRPVPLGSWPSHRSPRSTRAGLRLVRRRLRHPRIQRRKGAAQSARCKADLLLPLARRKLTSAYWHIAAAGRRDGNPPGASGLWRRVTVVKHPGRSCGGDVPTERRRETPRRCAI
jgi:hypothetical protein